MLKKIAFVTATLGIAPMAFALESAQARVTIVQASAMPSEVTFMVDTGTTSCPVGSWLAWANANLDNNKAVFALLIAAVNGGSRIQYFVNNGDTNCQVQFLYAVAS
jgi:hypothetical protein